MSSLWKAPFCSPAGRTCHQDDQHAHNMNSSDYNGKLHGTCPCCGHQLKCWMLDRYTTTSMGSLPLLMVSIIPAILSITGCHVLPSASARLPRASLQKEPLSGYMDVQFIQKQHEGESRTRLEIHKLPHKVGGRRNPCFPNPRQHPEHGAESGMQGAEDYGFFNPSPVTDPAARGAPIPHLMPNAHQLGAQN